ncbi:MAG: molybdopterin-dependent oxidoreductase [Pseudomonadota bacterium]
MVTSPLLPPNQALAAPGKWPVVGERSPLEPTKTWALNITGLVAEPKSWNLSALKQLGEEDFIVDIHCVTRWSRLGVRFRGIPLKKVFDECAILPSANFLSFEARSERNHSTSLPLKEALSLNAIIAFEHEGEPLTESHGGPIRMVVPGKYFYKSVKWLEKIEILAEDKLGYWEAENGYHNIANPWEEQRYVVSHLSRKEVIKLFATKDFSNCDLLGIEAESQTLEGLNASKALLRNAMFRKANLQNACFDGANLSNAHLEGANLKDASFKNIDGQIADLEGADFRGADLRGAVFKNASLFGATFCAPTEAEDTWGPVLIDATTQFDQASLESLSFTPLQASYIEKKLKGNND